MIEGGFQSSRMLTVGRGECNRGRRSLIFDSRLSLLFDEVVCAVPFKSLCMHRECARVG